MSGLRRCIWVAEPASNRRLFVACGVNGQAEKSSVIRPSKKLIKPVDELDFGLFVALYHIEHQGTCPCPFAYSSTGSMGRALREGWLCIGIRPCRIRCTATTNSLGACHQWPRAPVWSSLSEAPTLPLGVCSWQSKSLEMQKL